jgi:NAD(P)-dependent dehydrogenase (short-subunit alcohol dehydrogenase family)
MLKPAGRLAGKVAIVTGGDSALGRAVAVALAREGADVAMVFLRDHKEAHEVQNAIGKLGRQCMLLSLDVSQEELCEQLVREVAQKFRRIDILVNHASICQPQEAIEKITDQQLRKTFQTNVFSIFYLVKASLRHLKEGGAIINTACASACCGNGYVLDYAASKGAVIALTKSLAITLAPRRIRVNAVAPSMAVSGQLRAGQTGGLGKEEPATPDAASIEEIALCYVFLASGDSAGLSGQVLHPKGGSALLLDDSSGL